MRLKKFLFISVGSIVGVLFILITLVYFNKDKLASLAEQKINSYLNAHFDFSNAGISFRHFPRIGIRLNDVSITGIDRFAGDTLFNSASLDFAVNPFSLLKRSESIQIRYLHLERPDIKILILPDGTPNYMIFKMEEEQEEAEPAEGNDLALRLHSYTIKDGNVIYDDRAFRNLAIVRNIDQKGSGDFSARQFTMNTSTQVENCSFWQGSIPYLKEVAIDLDNILNVDLDQGRYESQETRLVLNELILLFDGFAVWNEDAATYEVSFETPQNHFKELISLIPSLYGDQYASMQASGEFSLSGKLARKDTTKYPAFQVEFSVSDGGFIYPGMDLGFSQIQINGNISNPGTVADATVVDIPRLNWILNERPFQASILLKTPYSDPDISSVLKGSVDLGDLQKVFPTAASQQLAGIIDADLNAKAKWSDIERQAYDLVEMGGEMTISDLAYKHPDYPVFNINNGSVHLAPDSWSVRKMDGSFGRSDFRLEGRLKNILSLISSSRPISGSFTLESDLLDVNEWIPEAEESDSGLTDTLYAVPEWCSRLNMGATVRSGAILYSDYKFTDASTSGTLSGQNLEFKDASCLFAKGRLSGNGQIEGIWDYVYRGMSLKGTLTIHSDKLDLNQFVEGNVAEEAATEASGSEEPVVIPVNYDFRIQYSSDEVSFQKALCSDVSGQIRIYEGKAEMKNMRGNLFGGRVLLNGTYSTINPQEPTFSFDYEIQNLDFQQTFKTFNTYSSLAPIGEFISGKFNSNLAMGARLRPDLTPVLTSIQAKGFLETFNAIISSFPPLEAASNFLQLEFLKNLNIQNTKNWFEVSEGKVTVRPFDLNIQGVSMTISGSHTLDQEIDYQLLMQLPYQRIAGKIKPGQSLAHLAAQANKLGIQLNENVQISLAVRLKGTIKQPVVEVDLVDNIKSVVTAQIKETVDSLRNVLKDEINEKRSEITSNVQAEITSIRNRADERVDQIMSEARRISEGIRKEGYARADQLIAVAGNDPIRKLAAQKAAEKLRLETDKKVEKILSDAERQAKSVFEQSEAKVDSLLNSSSG